MIDATANQLAYLTKLLDPLPDDDDKLAYAEVIADYDRPPSKQWASQAIDELKVKAAAVAQDNGNDQPADKDRLVARQALQRSSPPSASNASTRAVGRSRACRQRDSTSDGQRSETRRSHTTATERRPSDNDPRRTIPTDPRKSHDPPRRRAAHSPLAGGDRSTQATKQPARSVASRPWLWTPMAAACASRGRCSHDCRR